MRIIALYTCTRFLSPVPRFEPSAGYIYFYIYTYTYIYLHMHTHIHTHTHTYIYYIKYLCWLSLVGPKIRATHWWAPLLLFPRQTIRFPPKTKTGPSRARARGPDTMGGETRREWLLSLYVHIQSFELKDI